MVFLYNARTYSKNFLSTIRSEASCLRPFKYFLLQIVISSSGKAAFFLIISRRSRTIVEKKSFIQKILRRWSPRLDDHNIPGRYDENCPRKMANCAH